MKKTFLLLLLNLILFSSSYGQATIKGKVTDKKNGETLIGVTISLESKPGVGVTTDLDGNYTLILPDASVQTLIISYISYETKKEVVHPVMGETIIKDFTLQSVSTDLGTIEVQAKATRAKEYYMENIKKNASASIDFISSETMKKTGDVNVTAAVTRVSGVSMSNGFISVRGISDRYVKTTINGSRIPTLDPFTNNIRLDLFPASLIDNVILTKTASPDLPGDWAGAYISLETKDYPDKLTINMETSVGYNQQTTFKDIISTPHSKTEWLGYDNGLREYDHHAFSGDDIRLGDPPSSTNITPYQQFVGLGLENYFKSIGVNVNTPWTNAYTALGLVQLGLLDKELQGNKEAVAAALNKYNTGGYRERAFIEYRKQTVQSGQAFKNNWVPIKRKAPLNFSQSFSIGNQTKFLGRTLGVVAGFRYGSGIQYDPDSDINRVNSSQPKPDGTFDLLVDTIQRQIAKETHTWSALMNLSYKLNLNNTVSLVFMPNFTGVNNIGTQSNHTLSTFNTISNSQFYEQRKQLIYQYKSEHFLPGPMLKLDLAASYTQGNSSAPDFKDINYREEMINGIPTYTIGGEIGSISRYFRYLTDNVFDSRINGELPLKNSSDDLIKKLKFGVSYQNTYRKSDQYRYDVSVPSIGFNGDITEFLDISNFGIKEQADGTLTIPAFYFLFNSPENNSFGRSAVKGAFAMVDYSIIPLIRISGGLRIEQAELYTDLTKFDMLHLKADDPRRKIVNRTVASNPGQLNDVNYLPSATVIFKLKKDVTAPVNLRFNFSQTVARPSLREISDVWVFDYEYRTFVQGNSNLKTVKIKNYDARFESYFKSGDNISVSLFYKDFRDHIELVNFGNVSWQNVDKSYAMGIELEGRKAIVKHLEFRSNITFVRSQTTFKRDGVFGSGETIKRTMFGQAPYILNGMLIYTSDSLGLSLTLSYNVQGPRLAISSSSIGVPDIYELPRHALDFKINKKLGKRFSASLTVRDVLNSAIVRAYKFDTWDIKYDSYRYGTNYVLGVSYQF